MRTAHTLLQARGQKTVEKCGDYAATLAEIAIDRSGSCRKRKAVGLKPSSHQALKAWGLEALKAWGLEALRA
jgi:hypothetical protein